MDSTSTPTETPALPTPEEQSAHLRAVYDSEGAAVLIAHIQAQPALDRLKLYSLAQKTLGRRDENGEADGKGFDDYIEIVNAGIAEALRRSGAESELDKANGLKDTANIFSYNLTADLAECWEGDDRPRQARHFEQGLAAAEDCIRWRDELGKPPGRKSMAWWAKGMHEFSLKRFDDSLKSFQRSLELACEEKGTTPTSHFSAESDYSELLGLGYVGLAKIATGNLSRRADYEEAIRLFEEQSKSENAEVKEDAVFCIGQLNKVESKLTPFQ